MKIARSGASKMRSLFASAMTLSKVLLQDRTLVGLLAASLLFSSSTLYFAGFDLVNPTPSNWPSISNKSGAPTITRGDLLALTPPKLWDLMGIGKQFRNRHSGAGKVIGMVEGAWPVDTKGIQAFDAKFGLPAPSIKTIGDISATAPNTEETLDIEWAHAMAPKAKIDIFTLPDGPLFRLVPLLDWWQVMKEIKEDQPTDVCVTNILDGWPAMSALRLTDLLGLHAIQSLPPVFAAAGDNGPAATFPGMLPPIVSVGGMNAGIRIGPTPGTLKYLVVESLAGLSQWADTAGGFAWLTFSRPPYQNGYNPGLWRGTPDIAFIAGAPGYLTNHEGLWSVGEGASFAAPILAALWAAQSPPHPVTSGQVVASFYQAAGEAKAYLRQTGAGKWNIYEGLGLPDIQQLAGNPRLNPALPERYFPPLLLGGLWLVSAVLVFCFTLLKKPRWTVAGRVLILMAAAVALASIISLLLSSSAPVILNFLHNEAAEIIISLLYLSCVTFGLMFSFPGPPKLLQNALQSMTRKLRLKPGRPE